MLSNKLWKWTLNVQNWFASQLFLWNMKVSMLIGKIFVGQSPSLLEKMPLSASVFIGFKLSGPGSGGWTTGAKTAESDESIVLSDISILYLEKFCIWIPAQHRKVLHFNSQYQQDWSVARTTSHLLLRKNLASILIAFAFWPPVVF